MRVRKFAYPFAVALAAVAAVTALLWQLKLALSPQHLVFYYLLPTAAVAIMFGSLPALVCAAAGALCAAFLLYDPVFSFYIAGRLEVGEFVCFSVLAALSSKCAAEILRPAADNPAPREPLRD
jgi:K+-sensing histidine kinase KdpD